jgi:hypothetical protein
MFDDNDDSFEQLDDDIEQILQQAPNTTTTRAEPSPPPSALHINATHTGNFGVVYEISRPEIESQDLIIFRPAEINITASQTDRRTIQVTFEFCFDPASILAIAASVEQREDLVRYNLAPKTCIMKFQVPFEIGRISPARHAHANFIVLRIFPIHKNEEIKL